MKFVRGEVRYENHYVLDDLELELLEQIKLGNPIPTGSSNRSIMNALTRLRRNHFIENVGTRSRPQWKATGTHSFRRPIKL